MRVRHQPLHGRIEECLDIIDLDYAQWHTAADTIEAVAAGSLQIVGETLLQSLPAIEQRLLKP